MDEPLDLPDPALVVLVGPSGAGKSAWAAERYLPSEIVASDDLRGVVGSGRQDIAASADAFAVLELIVRARAGRGLTTVVDTLGLDADRRAGWLAVARAAGLPSVAVRFDTPAAQCRARNRQRPIPVPATVLTEQLRRARATPYELRHESWDRIAVVHSTPDPDPDPGFIGTASRSDGPIGTAARRANETGGGVGGGVGGAGGGKGGGKGGAGGSRPLSFVLQVSRFPWGPDPAGWLVEVGTAARECGFTGLALMDHLIQIPQVGRDWEDIPEPYVALGLLAGAVPDLDLGALVSPLSLRRPGLLAKALATLDVLSGGRAFCGVGAGWWEREHAAYALEFPSPGERLRLLAAGIETMRALWRKGTSAYDGELVHLPETTCYPRPVGPMPVVVGGRGPRLLEVAARWGDACNLPSDPAILDEGIERLAAACRTAGRDPAEVAVTVLDVPVVGLDRADVAARVEQLRGRTPAAAYARTHHAGTVDEQVARFRLLADRGVSTAFVALPGLTGADDVRRFAPVVAALGHVSAS